MKTIKQAIKEICKLTPEGAAFTLQPDFPAFNGHFPGMSVLPAVVMIQMALFAAGKKLKSVRRAKFISPVSAGDTAEFFISPKEVGLLDVVVKKNGAQCASFQIYAE